MPCALCTRTLQRWGPGTCILTISLLLLVCTVDENPCRWVCSSVLSSCCALCRTQEGSGLGPVGKPSEEGFPPPVPTEEPMRNSPHGFLGLLAQSLWCYRSQTFGKQPQTVLDKPKGKVLWSALSDRLISSHRWLWTLKEMKMNRNES